MTNPLALHIASMGYLAMEGIGVSLAKLMAKALTARSNQRAAASCRCVISQHNIFDRFSLSIVNY